MSEKQPPRLDGFSSGDYFDRGEYDPERVANLETGLYGHITDYADELLVSSYCQDAIASDSPSVVYDSEQRTISRVLSRYDYDSSLDGIDGRMVETRIDIRYRDSIDSPKSTNYRIEIRKTQEAIGNEESSMTVLYDISQFGNADVIVAEMIYPDVINNTYSSRMMTPYDEKSLHDELALMASYIQIKDEGTNTELASDEY